MATIGDDALRAKVWDESVKQIAERKYRFKQAVSITTTSAWQNNFYRESTTPLAGGTGSSFEGIPRGANFPTARKTWTEVPTWIKKHGAEDSIFWEDILSDNFNVQTRVLVSLTEGVVKSVDDEIYEVLSENAQAATYGVATSPANINHVAVSATKHWSGTSAAIMDDIWFAAQLIAVNGYFPTTDLMVFVSPKDKRSVMRWITDKGVNFQSLSSDVAINGSFGKFGGATFIESISVPASNALVVVPQTCGTWKNLVPLQTTTITDPYRSVKVRVVEEGVTQLHNPKAVALISNTQGPGTE